MPKVFLSDRDREAERERRQNEVFSLALRTARGRLGIYDKEIQAKANVCRSSLYAMKKAENVGSTQFSSVRRVAHEIRLSADEWLKLGGYL